MKTLEALEAISESQNVLLKKVIFLLEKQDKRIEVIEDKLLDMQVSELLQDGGPISYRSDLNCLKEILK